MIETLKKMFEASAEKSTIVLKGKCLDCGCETIVNITSTAGGFGLQGGVLFKSSPNEYLVKCPDCYKINQNENMYRKKEEQKIQGPKWRICNP